MFSMRMADLRNRMLTLAPERVYPPFQPSLLRCQGPDTINIQVPFGPPACYPFWNRRPELFIETECILQELLRSKSFREVTHRRACSAKRIAELALQVSLHALRFDGAVRSEER